MTTVFSSDLEKVISAAYQRAREQGHEWLTVEHLTLGLLDDPSTSELLTALGADVDELRVELVNIIAQTTPVLPPDADTDTQPTMGFQRVLQRAVYHVQSGGGAEVTGANVLVALFGENDSHGVNLLQKQGLTRLRVIHQLLPGVSNQLVDVDLNWDQGSRTIQERLAAIEARLERIEKKLGD